MPALAEFEYPRPRAIGKRQQVVIASERHPVALASRFVASLRHPCALLVLRAGVWGYC